jgi:hypothetical protein
MHGYYVLGEAHVYYMVDIKFLIFLRGQIPIFDEVK